MPTECFGHLLRFFEDKVIRPLGGKRFAADVRILAATNAPRKIPVDLEYRFDTVLTILPLRERREQIPKLAARFFTGAKKGSKKRSLRFPVEERERLANDFYDWPGNVRQLKKAIEGAIIIAAGDRDITAKMIVDEARGRRLDR